MHLQTNVSLKLNGVFCYMHSVLNYREIVANTSPHSEYNGSKHRVQWKATHNLLVSEQYALLQHLITSHHFSSFSPNKCHLLIPSRLRSPLSCVFMVIFSHQWHPSTFAPSVFFFSHIITRDQPGQGARRRDSQSNRSSDQQALYIATVTPK